MWQRKGLPVKNIFILMILVLGANSYASGVSAYNCSYGYNKQNAATQRDCLFDKVEKTAYDKPYIDFSGPSSFLEGITRTIYKGYDFGTGGPLFVANVAAFISNPLATFLSPFASYLALTFTHKSDFMPYGRRKVIHAQGSVAKITMNITSATYTGLLSKGEHLGLIRLSVAVPQFTGNFIPGFGLKFFVEGRPSENMVAMYQLSGQGKDSNFFKHSFSNNIDAPDTAPLKVGAWIFKNAMDTITTGGKANYLPLGNFARVNGDGTSVSRPIAPHHLVFVPKVEATYGSDYSVNFREELRKVWKGGSSETIYEIQAFNTDNTDESEVGKVIGTLELNSKLVDSRFGDKVLFFRHPIFP
jgi:hypothetical protein